ncbi:hypothetical protein BATDEDRAFT_86245 [Batrachochytrium dendrobatidis JAM81]|uniref:ABC transporter domain-containing protein n=2 Tax=Batrachochytrium dendrobatidis TaxID=109871 RepID=F4NW88_BATDJ|nr:uncharacterized protein BATDEDRAFT_86245 [Batrachochytrium dendrobatidis JAM81]EGF82438.1 hypothetical protein BATDEDRAFT_86245 [Batrachochytrium dendrobatidis JAM81]|eukprot:XP_006676924.1 hypothetical protein BATDEDRAFT_86245 [Batrachochytrium dendrobatidis JAM81]
MDKFRPILPLTVAAENVGVSIESFSWWNLFTGQSAAFRALSNVSFNAAPGQVIAIMGASGSGKTTLLHMLAGRIQNAKVDGSVTFDGQPPQSFYSNGSVGYVQQYDYLMPYLTVRETLRYCAELRLSKTIAHHEKLNLVEEVILELGLKECADTIIGNDWRKGISGGEKRRVSVGCELLLNPSVLFMDEPTTGLDSFTSLNLMETLVSLSRRGRTVLISIHQPRSDIFKLFDSVILLAKGMPIYAGKNGPKLIQHFADLGHFIPENTNPADSLIDICSINTRSEQEEIRTLKVVEHLTSTWAELVKSDKHLDYAYKPRVEMVDPFDNSTASILTESTPNEMLQTTTADSLSMPKRLPISSSRHSGASTLSQCAILTRRAWNNLLRDNLSLWGSLIETIAVGLIFGAIFYQLQDTLSGVFSRRGALYIASSIQTYLMLIFVIYKLTTDIKVMDRERADHMYGVVPYVFGQFMSQLPFNIIFPLIYSVILYFMMGLRTDNLAFHFINFAAANLLGHWVIIGYSQFCVSLARDFATASLIGSAMYTFYSSSSGFFVQLETIPIYIKWISKISFLTYQYRLMISNEFSDNTFACADAGAPCSGNSILRSMAIDVHDYQTPLISLLLIFVIFMVVSTIILQFLNVNHNKHAGTVKSSIKMLVKDEDAELGISDSHSNSKNHHSSIHVKIKSLTLQLTIKSIMPSTPTIKKVLLDNVTTSFPPNSLSIIMGGSGTGKSTLLSVLTARKLKINAMSKLDQTGTVMFNDIPENNPARIASVCSFVPQSDSHLLPALTCRETLHYAAMLRLPSEWTKKQKQDQAEQILAVLGLRHCANTVVGSEFRKGISGGEKRRLSIGVQMLTDPSVLVIDEPTSGLDAFTAHHIMLTLKNLAQSGRTIVCSIHQPRSDIFSMFDHILLLARGGRVAYSGPALQIMPHFIALGHELPAFTNPADYILDISSIDFRNAKAEATTRVQVDHIVDYWKSCTLSTTLDLNDTKADVNGSKSAEADGSLEIKPRKKTSFFNAFYVLSIRSIVNTQRQPLLVIARIMQVVFLGIIQAIYLPNQSYNQTSIQNRIGVLQQTVAVLFVGLLNCVAVFPPERDLLYHEFADGAYTLGPFFFAYNLIEIPIEIVSALLYSLFIMFAIGLNTTPVTYMCMALSVFCFVNIGESIGIAFCSIVNHVGFSVSLTNSVLGVFVVMSGMLSSNMPLVLDRLNRISPIPYLTRLMAINEFQSNVIYTCTQQEILTGTCMYHTGSDVLKLLSGSTDTMAFESNKFVLYIVVGCVLAVAYRLIAYMVLLFKVRM